jgi:hypothetical protein
LGALLASSRDAAARQAGTAIDREQWRRIVGERIAARTEPGPKRGRELLVYVASASWAQELSLLVTEIVVRLKAAGIAVDHVRFSVRTIAKPTRDAAALRPPVRKAVLPAALNQKLDGIEDPELREAIADAAALWLALGDATPVASPKRSATSTRPAARSPRAAESQSARSDHRSGPARAASKDKP